MCSAADTDRVYVGHGAEFFRVFCLYCTDEVVNASLFDNVYGTAAKAAARHSCAVYAVEVPSGVRQKIKLRAGNLKVVLKRKVRLTHKFAELGQVSVLKRFRSQNCPMVLTDRVFCAPFTNRILDTRLIFLKFLNAQSAKRACFLDLIQIRKRCFAFASAVVISG